MHDKSYPQHDQHFLVTVSRGKAFYNISMQFTETYCMPNGYRYMLVLSRWGLVVVAFYVPNCWDDLGMQNACIYIGDRWHSGDQWKILGECDASKNLLV